MHTSHLTTHKLIITKKPTHERHKQYFNTVHINVYIYIRNLKYHVCYLLGLRVGLDIYLYHNLSCITFYSMCSRYFTDNNAMSTTNGICQETKSYNHSILKHLTNIFMLYVDLNTVSIILNVYFNRLSA